MREAMQARPVELSSVDLVAASLMKVRAMEARAAKLAHIGRWMRLSGLAAGVLLLLTLAAAFYGFSSGSADGKGEVPSAVTSVDSTGSTTYGLELSGGTGVLLRVGLIGVVLWLVMSEPARPRFTPAT